MYLIVKHISEQTATLIFFSCRSVQLSTDIGAAGQIGRNAVSHVVTVIERDLGNATIQNLCVEVCTVQERQPRQMAVL